MLAQPAGNVIGFATANDAIEAGYQPDPECRDALMNEQLAAQRNIPYAARTGGSQGTAPSNGGDAGDWGKYNQEMAQYQEDIVAWSEKNKDLGRHYRSLENALATKQAQGIPATSAERQAVAQAQQQFEDSLNSKPEPPIEPESHRRAMRNNFKNSLASALRGGG